MFVPTSNNMAASIGAELWMCMTLSEGKGCVLSKSWKVEAS